MLEKIILTFGFICVLFYAANGNAQSRGVTVFTQTPISKTNNYTEASRVNYQSLNSRPTVSVRGGGGERLNVYENENVVIIDSSSLNGSGQEAPSVEITANSHKRVIVNNLSIGSYNNQDGTSYNYKPKSPILSVNGDPSSIEFRRVNIRANNIYISNPDCAAVVCAPASATVKSDINVKMTGDNTFTSR